MPVSCETHAPANDPQNGPPFSPRARLCGLYVITDAHRAGGHVPITRAALTGGAKIIQLRDKTTPLSELLPIAREMRRLTQQHNALLIINDRADLALCVRADGVHLGPDDLPVCEVRRLFGPHLIIGASCGTNGEALTAWHDGADYIGCGAVFGTQTKSDAGEAIGLTQLREVIAGTPLPVAAIGGINLENIAATRQNGASMAAVITAVTNAETEEAMTRATRALIAQFNP